MTDISPYYNEKNVKTFWSRIGRSNVVTEKKLRTLKVISTFTLRFLSTGKGFDGRVERVGRLNKARASEGRNL